ncbi:MAG: hypothetical protein QM754_19470 [Tepidisphaeraceae bacterium]
MIANTVARLCFQEYELRQRFNELTTIYNVTMMLTEPRDLKKLLDRTVRAVCEVMDVRAASIRLIDREKDELVIKAVHNLSPQYLNKGPVRATSSEIDKVAWGPRGYELVLDMQNDPRVTLPRRSPAGRHRQHAERRHAVQGPADRRAEGLHRHRAPFRAV